MTNKKTNNNYDEYMEKIKLPPSRRNLKMWTEDEAEITQANLNKWIKEGDALLIKEKATKYHTKDDSRKLESELGTTSSNPYIRARMEILRKMSKDRLRVIEKMEDGSLPKDRRYDEFVKEVAKLGDKMTS